MFTLKGLKATKTGFGEGLRDAGALDPDIVALGADITGSVSMDLFRNDYPDRFFSFGIAEQNIAGVAAGLALAGKIPFMATYGVFSALRTTDQLRVSVCYNNLPVRIGGAHAGISVGPDGATHQALEDIGVMRVLPNMTVLSPCDATQARLAVLATIKQCPGPVYIRFGREPVPDFTEESLGFTIGKGQIFREGTDVTIIATGHMVWESLLAAEILAKQNISARVLNLHTIKPLDTEIILKAARETGCFVTAEEHQIACGLGSAVAETVTTSFPVPLVFVGMKDSFGESGQPEELLAKYGMKDIHIVKAAIESISLKMKLKACTTI